MRVGVANVASCSQCGGGAVLSVLATFSRRPLVAGLTSFIMFRYHIFIFSAKLVNLYC